MKNKQFTQFFLFKNKFLLENSFRLKEKNCEDIIDLYVSDTQFYLYELFTIEAYR